MSPAEPPVEPAAWSASNGIGPNEHAEADRQLIEDFRRDLAIRVAKTVGATVAKSARTAAWTGGLIQLFGAVLVGLAVVSQLVGIRPFEQTEFVVVMLTGLTLVLAGPYVGRRAAEPLVDEEKIVERVTETFGSDAVAAGKAALAAQDKEASA